MTHFRTALFDTLQRIDLRLAEMRRLPDSEETDGLRTLRRRCIDALIRLNERSYGECTRCLERIPLERLVALPWAELCMKCETAGSPALADPGSD